MKRNLFLLIALIALLGISACKETAAVDGGQTPVGDDPAVTDAGNPVEDEVDGFGYKHFVSRAFGVEFDYPDYMGLAADDGVDPTDADELDITSVSPPQAMCSGEAVAVSFLLIEGSFEDWLNDKRGGADGLELYAFTGFGLGLVGFRTEGEWRLVEGYAFNREAHLVVFWSGQVDKDSPWSGPMPMLNLEATLRLTGTLAKNKDSTGLFISSADQIEKIEQATVIAETVVRWGSSKK